jgi:hypothetical protein
MKILILIFSVMLSACSVQSSENKAPQIEYRDAAPLQEDDLTTTNDESNDQPLGHYGVITLCVTNYGSGNSYPLDAEMDGFNVDFIDCTLDEDMTGECDDEEDRGWIFDGEC